MLSSPPPLILPVENQVREFDARLLLACVAAERGFPVVLGSRPFISMAIGNLERGIFVAKSMRPRSRLMFGIIRDLGHELVAWDEESLVRFQSEEYYAWRFSPETFRSLGHLFAWGEDDAEMFAAYPGCSGIPIHVTGNPRIDLLRPELRGFFAQRAQELRDQFGAFILVNTNFSFVNNFVPALNLVLDEDQPGRARVSRTGQGMSLGFASGLAAHQRAVFNGFRRLLPELAVWFPDRQIVLRPHPSEDHDAWRSALAGFPNVHVRHEGNVVPWLMACSVLLHNGCTTAVEAAVLGTPAVSFRPVTSPCFDYPLPNALSHEVFDEAGVRSAINGIHSNSLGTPDRERQRALLARHLAALDGPLAADRAVDVMEGIAALPPRRPAKVLVARIKSSARAALKQVNLARHGHWNSAEYHEHRFPDIDAAEINRRISRFRDLLGRFGGIEAQASGRYMFRINGAPHQRARGAA